MTAPTPFLARFESISLRLRRVQLGQRLTQALLVGLAGLGALAAADYAFELPWAVRASGFALLGLAVAMIAVAGLVAVFRKWTRPQTAVAIEQTFPELGQRVRTVEQFVGRKEAARTGGVAATLTEALHEDTTSLARPLSLDLVVPTRRLLVLAGAALAAVAAAVGLTAIDPDWRTAFQRAFLSDQPWTRLSVEPGDAVVKDGDSLTVTLALTGRTGRPVTLFWRSADDAQAPWTEHTFTAPANRSRSQEYALPLAKIHKPLVYKATAGPLATATHRVDVRYPLKLAGVNVELTPPAYTGLKPSKQKDPDISGLVGTKVRMQFELDRAPSKARLVLTSTQSPKAGEDVPAPQPVPVRIDGKSLLAELELTADQAYTIEAEAADGMSLAQNRHRIRVRPDQPPSVWFEDPPEALEVHPLVEVLMRIRARDDFGLSRSGIVFQVNNEEEHTLLMEDFAAALKDGKSPTTQSILEKLLPLEHFELTQKDSVTYYAFAEDNFPGGARRAETDLRFVDIRPFRRVYQVFDPADSPMGEGRELASLEELIARQRYALNQTLRMAKRAEAAKADVAALDKLVGFEGKLATATHELAEFLESLMVDGSDLLYQAEDAMLAAVDSLQVGKFDNATLQERDALRYLIEGRDKVQLALSKKPQAVRDQVKQFSRTQAQKLRRPKDEAETAAEVVERLKQLAMNEEFVYETLSGLRMEGAPPSDTPQKTKGSSGSGMPEESDPMKSEGTNGEKPKPGEERPGEKKTDGSKDVEPKAEGPPGPTREEIQAKQQEITDEAYAIQKALEKLQGISDLVKQRMEAASKGAEATGSALSRGQTEEAARESGKAAGMFKELARNVEGLVAGETAEKVAMARDISDELSVLERQLANELARQQSPGENLSQEPSEKGTPGSGERSPDKQPGNSPMSQEPGHDGSGGPEPGQMPGRGSGEPGPQDKAGALAETGKTLLDILSAIAKSDEPADQEAVNQIGGLLKEGKLKETIERMQGLVDKLKVGERQGAGLAAADVADNLESAARTLDALHRQIVAPRVAGLMKLEQEATELAGELENLETESQIAEWHADADKLLDELERAGLSPREIEELRAEMKAAGWGNVELSPKRWGGWALEAGRYAAPAGYSRVTRRLVQDLQSRIQELVLKEMVAAGDEAAPPEYERLIEKYYQVLSGDLGKK